MNKKGKARDIDFSKMKKVRQKNRHIDNSFHFYLSYNSRLFLLVIAVLILCLLSYFFILKSFAVYETKTLEYSENGNVNYNISLKENNFYSSPTQEEGRQYISELIDSINTTFHYNSFFSDKAIIIYNYDIVGKLYIYSEEGNILFDEEYPLISKTDGEILDKKLNIEQELDIDYNKFNEIAKSYRDTYAPNATSKFVVTMRVNYEGSYSEFEDTLLNRSTKLEMTMPLLKDSIVLDINDKYLEDDGEYEEVEQKSKINNVFSYLGSLFLIFATLVAIYMFSFILRARPKKSKYCMLRDSYLAEYDRLIVNSKSLPDFKNAHVIECYDFNELLDAEELLELPINYYEIVRNQKCVFFIMNGKEVFKYTLKECDLEY